MISSSHVLLFQTNRILKSFYPGIFYRYVRSIGKRETAPNLVKGKVRTLTKYDDSPRIESYQDLIKNIKESELGDELEVERAFANEDTFGDPFEKADRFFDMHLKEEREMKSRVKKQIIKNKYFKLDKETNLLTYSAKQQIRQLHKSNPQEWDPKAIAECFPISETGAKRLLKSSFSPANPDVIKAHDKVIVERWEILKSGKFTTSISPVTQKLYREGKLKDDYFSGNPNLPSIQPDKKVLKVEMKKTKGEFSRIVETYANLQKQKLLGNPCDVSENQVVLKRYDKVNDQETKNLSVRKFKYASEEFDKETEELFLRPKKVPPNDMDLPLSRFKEILEEEGNISFSEDTSENLKQKNAVVQQFQKDTFHEVPKYEKDNIEMVSESNKNEEIIYKYDDRLGYQHPTGKTIRRRINLPPKLHKQEKLFRKGNYVFSEDGEFLYKVPT